MTGSPTTFDGTRQADCLLTSYGPGVNASGAAFDPTTPDATHGLGITYDSKWGHVVTRWADPDAGGSGVSGPPNNVTTLGYGAAHPFTGFVNNNSIPRGGPQELPSGQTVSFPGHNYGTTSSPNVDSSCPWTFNNCGMNDEPFSFHPSGCNSVFVDGSVHFLGETIDPSVMRALVDRAGNVKVSPDDMPR